MEQEVERLKVVDRTHTHDLAHTHWSIWLNFSLFFSLQRARSTHLIRTIFFISFLLFYSFRRWFRFVYFHTFKLCVFCVYYFLNPYNKRSIKLCGSTSQLYLFVCVWLVDKFTHNGNFPVIMFCCDNALRLEGKHQLRSKCASQRGQMHWFLSSHLFLVPFFLCQALLVSTYETFKQNHHEQKLNNWF